MIDEETENLVPSPVAVDEPQQKQFMSKTKILVTIVAVLALSALFLANKGLLVAAVVNGRPIFTWQLNKTLMDRFGQQTLEGMISEQLIADEAQKQGVRTTQADIDTKQKEILRSLGDNVKLEDLLKYQGITKTDFDNQIKLQITVQKILGKNILITDSDISNYIATNSASLSATDPAALREQAKQAILDQKVGELLQPWFLALKQKAKVLRFVN